MLVAGAKRPGFYKKRVDVEKPVLRTRLAGGSSKQADPQSRQILK
jgi:hypothetical protein